METFYDPSDKNMDLLKDPSVTKSVKKDIIMTTLHKNKPQFYLLRPILHHNYYYYCVKLFTDAGDEELFQEITTEVCKDILANPLVFDQYGNRVDLFANTFLSQQIINESPFNVLAQQGKFDFIDILLEVIKKAGLNTRLDVKTTDNYNKTILDHAVEQKKVSLIRMIAEKHAEDFNFDLDKVSRNGKSIQIILDNKYSPLVKHMIDDDFRAFEEYFESALEGKEEELPEEDRFDTLGFSFVHSLCLLKDNLYLDLILHHWDESPDKVRKTLFITDINTEMNRIHKATGLTPILSILTNGDTEMVEYLFEKIFVNRIVNVDIALKDQKNHNILHLLFLNPRLTLATKLDILNKYMAVLSESVLHNHKDVQPSNLYNQLDSDGLSPLTTFICHLSNSTQNNATEKLVLDFMVERTSFQETIFKVRKGALVHPFIPCIQLNLQDVYDKLLESMPELESTVFFCDYTTGRTTLEYAFLTKNTFFIEKITESLGEVNSFIVHENRITLFDILERIFNQLVEEKVIQGDEDSKDSENQLLSHYRSLANKIYSETKNRSGADAYKVLQKLKINTPELLKDQNDQSEYAKVKAKKLHQHLLDQGYICDYVSLFHLSYRNNNFVTFPLISSIKNDLWVEISKINVKKSSMWVNVVGVPTNKQGKDLFLTKHKDIFSIILAKIVNKQLFQSETYKNSYASEDEEKKLKEDDFISMIDELLATDHQISKAISMFDSKQFFTDLYDTVNEHLEWTVQNAAFDILIDTFVQAKKKPELNEFMCVVSNRLAATKEKDFAQLFDSFTDMLVQGKHLLNFDGEHSVESYQKNILSSAVFWGCFKSLEKYQAILEKSIVEYFFGAVIPQYKNALKAQEEKGGKNPNDYDSFMNAPDKMPAERIHEILKNFGFKSGKLIEIAQDPEVITSVLMNFLKLGGYSHLNVELGDLKKDTSKAKDLVKALKYLHNNKRFAKKRGIKYSCFWELCKRPELNDITLDLIYEESLSLISNIKDYYDLPWVEAMRRDNFPVILKYLEHFDFRCKKKRAIQNAEYLGDPIKGFYQSGKGFENMRDAFFRRPWVTPEGNDTVKQECMKFLMYFANQKEHIDEIEFKEDIFLEMTNESDDMLLRIMENPEGKDKDTAKDANNEEGEGEYGYDLESFDDPRSYFYFYYSYPITKGQIGKDIPKFNLLFYYQMYLPDMLIDKLTLDEIKKLNSAGFVIGKYSYQCWNLKWMKDKKYAPNLQVKDIDEIFVDRYGGDRVEGYATSSAFQYAMSIYIQNKAGINEEVIEYLLKLLLAQKEATLIMPKTIFLLLKGFPSNHKLVDLALPTMKDIENYVFFKTDCKPVPEPAPKLSSAYGIFYPDKVRCELWKTIPYFLLTKEDVFDAFITEVQKNMKTSIDKIKANEGTISDLENQTDILIKLFRTSFNLASPKKDLMISMAFSDAEVTHIQREIVKTVSMTENKEIFKEKFNIDVYDPSNISSVAFCFNKLTSELHANAKKEASGA
ncbi:unnamed protein product [Moneuplotes crassus]|uniref:Uncharacterized protein n=1 Tax=Euplotes crassus TaxID=5936 RepID=A0AAD1Y6U1_EUPCR|nr:unnamed protein product [Moneuplotes crassus]